MSGGLKLIGTKLPLVTPPNLVGSVDPVDSSAVDDGPRQTARLTRPPHQAEGDAPRQANELPERSASAGKACARRKVQPVPLSTVSRQQDSVDFQTELLLALVGAALN